ncbi:MAG: O-antigen ligase family protein [Candidatus Omnitrophota bacterium]
MLFIICHALSENHSNKIFQTIISSAITISCIGIYQFFFDFQNTLDYLNTHKMVDPLITQFIQQKRIYAVMITPNALGGYLTMLVPLVLFLKNKFWILPIAIALILTKSIGAILALLLIFPFYVYQRRLFNPSIFLIFLNIILIIIGIMAWRSQTHINIFNLEFSLEMRWSYWKETWAIIQAHPFSGIGLGNFNLTNTRYSHNIFLQLWAETGLAGILSFLYMITTILYKIWDIIKINDNPAHITALFFAIIIFLVHNMIDFTFYIPEISLIWCIILGLACNQSSKMNGGAMPDEKNLNPTKTS